MPASRSKWRILFLAQLPPPVHGASLVTQRVFHLLKDMENVDVTHMWGGSAHTLNDIGKKNVRKLLEFARLLTELAGQVVCANRYNLAYLAFAPGSHTAIRDALLIFASKFLAKRTLVHLHTAGLEMVLQPGSLHSRLIRQLLMGSELIAITDDTARMARNSGMFRHVHTLANAAPDPGRPSITPSHEIMCGWLGNLDRRKGVLQFIDTVSGLRGTGLDVKGMIGGGPTRRLSIEDVERHLSNKSLNGCVDILGRVTGDNKSKFLSQLHLFIYLSRHDLAPLALIEAMAHGAVPIVLDTGGIRQMVGAHFACNVLPSGLDANACQAKITEIVKRYCDSPDLLVADRQAARARYLTEFSESVFRQRTAQIISNASPKGIHGRVASMANIERHANL